MEVVRPLLEISAIRTRLRAIAHCYEEFSCAGEQAVSGILLIQKRAMRSELFTTRIAHDVQLLQASAEREFLDVNDQGDAKRALAIGLQLVDEINGLAESTESGTEKEPTACKPLVQVVGWEHMESVRILRSIWRHTADAVESRLSTPMGSTHCSSRATMNKPVSAKYMVEIAAGFMRRVFGLVIRLDENAFAADKYSFAFNVIDEESLASAEHNANPEQGSARTDSSRPEQSVSNHSHVIGTVYLHVKLSGAYGSTLFPVTEGLDGSSTPSSVISLVIGHAVAHGSSVTIGPPQEVMGSQLALESQQALGLTASQTDVLETVKLGDTSMHLFAYFVTSVSRILAMKGPIYFDQSTSLTVNPRQPVVSNPLLLRLVTERMIDLITRDLKEAILGVPLGDSREQPMWFTWRHFFRYLDHGARVAVAPLDDGSRLDDGSPTDVAQVLGTRPDHPMLQRMAADRSRFQNSDGAVYGRNGHIEALSRALAAMVHQRGKYRAKIYELHGILERTLRHDTPHSPRLMGSPRTDSVVKVCDAASRITPDPDLATLRAFLNPRLRDRAPQSISSLLPELRRDIDNRNIEDAIDYAPLINELVPRTRKEN